MYAPQHAYKPAVYHRPGRHASKQGSATPRVEGYMQSLITLSSPLMTTASVTALGTFDSPRVYDSYDLESTVCFCVLQFLSLCSALCFDLFLLSVFRKEDSLWLSKRCRRSIGY